MLILALPVFGYDTWAARRLIIATIILDALVINSLVSAEATVLYTLYYHTGAVRQSFYLFFIHTVLLSQLAPMVLRQLSHSRGTFKFPDASSILETNSTIPLLGTEYLDGWQPK